MMCIQNYIVFFLLINTSGKALQILYGNNIEYSNKYVLYCVSDDYTDAISWYAETNQNLQSNSTPCTHKLQPINFNWVQHHWANEFSYKSTLGPVLDYTWENFHTVMTPPKIGYQERYEFELLSTLSNIYGETEINLSIMAGGEAHTFLCDNYDIRYASCLWIILGGWKRKSSLLRHCDRGKVPLYTRIYRTCKDLIPIVDVNPLSEHDWRHITFRYDDQETFVVLHEDETIMMSKDIKANDFASYKYVFARSENEYVIWKYHDYSYYAGRLLTTPTVSEFLRPADSRICVSFFTSHRYDIVLNLKSEGKIIQTKRYLNKKQDEKWRFRMFQASNLVNKYYQLELEVSSQDNVLIRNFNRHNPCGATRECNIIIRNKTIMKEVTCSSVKQKQHLKVQQIQDNICLSNATKCQTCDKMYNDTCPFRLVCESNFCHCRPGTVGEYCERDCPYGSYGAGCINQCGACKGGKDCLKDSGECLQGCQENFLPPLCNLHDKPVLLNISSLGEDCYNNCTVQIYSEELNYSGTQTPKSYYFILFKNGLPILVSPVSQISEKSFTLQKLTKNTKYKFQIILCTDEQGYDCYKQTGLVNFPFSTSCKEIANKDVQFKSVNRTLYIEVLPEILADDIFCDINEYSLNIFNDKIRVIYDYPLQTIGKLNYYTTYTLVVYRLGIQIFERTILTDESVPERVQDPKVEPSSNSALISWSSPFPVLGEVTHYEIYYARTDIVNCPGRKNNNYLPSNIITTKEKVLLEGLASYSKYKITITAFTKKGPGLPVELTLSTNSSDNLIFTNWNHNISTSESFAHIRFDIDCEQWIGPTFVFTEITCTSVWCENTSENKTQELTESRPEVYLSLKPFTDYNLKVFLRRVHSGAVFQSISEVIHTKSAVPYAIPYMDVYTKTETSLSVRWQPPYPPTGILQNFSITYETTRGYYRSKIYSFQKCAIWEEMFCATLSNLYKGYAYKISIAGMNEGIPGFANSKILEHVEVRITEPDPPYDIDKRWNESDYLALVWKHPNRTNGPLEKFLIIINNKRYDYYPRSPMRNYFFESEFECTPQQHSATVQFITTNSKKSSETVTKSFSCPVFKPKLTSEPEVNSMENNTVILKIPNVLKGEKEGKLFIIVLTENKFGEGDCSSGILSCINPGSQACWTIQEGVYNAFQNPTKVTITKLPFFNFNRDYHKIIILLVNVYNNESSHTIYELGPMKDDDRNMPMTENQNWWWISILLLISTGCIAGGIFVYHRKTGLNTRKMFKSTEEIIAVSETDRLDIIPLSDNISKPNSVISISGLETYLRYAVKEGLLEKEYESVPRGLQHSTKVGSQPENRAKNRYPNIIAYDHSRVLLKKSSEKIQEDYINANYIDSFICEKAYIATQAPKERTIYDFWHMILTEGVEHIIMLANMIEKGKVKVNQYWPDGINQIINYDDIAITTEYSTTFSNYVVRSFIVNRNNVCKQIKQLHFTSWPDHGVPMYAQNMLSFAKTILEIPHTSQHPILVHCSAGVGRTGTIILIDICLRMGISQQKFNVLKALESIRAQRANLVEPLQYKFAYLALLEYFTDIDSTYDCADFESVHINLSDDQIKKQMLFVNEAAWRETVLNPDANVPVAVEENKNRDETIVPEKQGCIYLRPLTEGGSTYINAVFVDGFNEPKKFIATQHPLCNTVDDFWRMVFDNDISVIVSLQAIYDTNFWVREEEFVTVEGTKVEHISEREASAYFVHELDVTIRGKPIRINLIEGKHWLLHDPYPKNVHSLLDILKEMESLKPINNTSTIIPPYLVVCRNGARACGFFIAMCNLIERIKLEQVCDVCQCVRNVRRSRKQFLTELIQFKGLYRLAALFLSEFNLYSNFKPQSKPL